VAQVDDPDPSTGDFHPSSIGAGVAPTSRREPTSRTRIAPAGVVGSATYCSPLTAGAVHQERHRSRELALAEALGPELKLPSGRQPPVGPERSGAPHEATLFPNAAPAISMGDRSSPYRKRISTLCTVRPYARRWGRSSCTPRPSNRAPQVSVALTSRLRMCRRLWSKYSSSASPA